MASPGRPPKEEVLLSEEQKALALSLASQGATLKKIREELKITQEDFRRYRERFPIFETNLQRARQDGLEEIVDDLLSITEDIADVNKARLKSENIRWIAAKRKPTVYGDRIDVNISQTVDIGQALLDARNRASLPIIPQNNIVDAESVRILDTCDVTTTDSVSVVDSLDDILS